MGPQHMTEHGGEDFDQTVMDGIGSILNIGVEGVILSGYLKNPKVEKGKGKQPASLAEIKQLIENRNKLAQSDPELNNQIYEKLAERDLYSWGEYLKNNYDTQAGKPNAAGRELHHQLAELNDQDTLNPQETQLLESLPVDVLKARCPKHAEQFNLIGHESTTDPNIKDRYPQIVAGLEKKTAEFDGQLTVATLDADGKVVEHGSILYLNPPQTINGESQGWIELYPELEGINPHELPLNAVIAHENTTTEPRIATKEYAADTIGHLRAKDGARIEPSNFSLYAPQPEVAAPAPEPAAKPAAETSPTPSEQKPSLTESGEIIRTATYPRYENDATVPAITVEQAQQLYPDWEQWQTATKELVIEAKKLEGYTNATDSEVIRALQERISQPGKYTSGELANDSLHKLYEEFHTRQGSPADPEAYLMALESQSGQAEVDGYNDKLQATLIESHRREVFPQSAVRDLATGEIAVSDERIAAVTAKGEAGGLYEYAFRDLQSLQLLNAMTLDQQELTHLQNLQGNERLYQLYEYQDRLATVLRRNSDPAQFPANSRESQIAQRVQEVKRTQGVNEAVDKYYTSTAPSEEKALEINVAKLDIKRIKDRLDKKQITISMADIDTQALKALEALKPRRTPEEFRKGPPAPLIHRPRYVQAPTGTPTTPPPSPNPTEATPSPKPAEGETSEPAKPSESEEPLEEFKTDIEPPKVKVEDVPENKPAEEKADEEPQPAPTDTTTPAPTPTPAPPPGGPTPPPSDQPGETLTLNAAVAAVKAEIGGREVTKDGLFGQKREKTYTREQAEGAGAHFARLMQTEIRKKWETKGQPIAERVKTFSERLWKSFVMEKPHYIKEKRHGIDMMAAAGIQGSMPYELFTQIDTAARAEVAAGRNTRIKRIWGGVKDFAAEVTAAERDLHKKRTEIAHRWRQQYEANPLDTANPLHPFRQADYQAMRAVADRIGDTAFDATLHAELGEQRITVELDGTPEGKTVKAHLANEIIKPLLSEYLTTGDPAVQAKAKLAAQEKLDNYFLSNEFQAFRAQHSELALSLTYSTNLIEAATRPEYVEQIRQQVDHDISLDKLDLDIKLTLGTARFGPTGEVPSRVWGEKKAELTEKVWTKMKEWQQKHNASSIRMAYVDEGTQRQTMVAFANEALGLSAVALAPAIVYGAGLTIARATPLAAFAPLTAAIGGGIRAGIKEYQLLAAERGDFNIQTAMGEMRPADARKAAEIAKFDYARVDITERVSALTAHTEIDLAKPENVATLLGLIADTEARSTLNAKYNLELYSSSLPIEGSTIKPDFNENKHQLDRALSEAKVKLSQALTANDALRQTVATQAGFAAAADAKEIMAGLKGLQTMQLEAAATLSDREKQAFEFALKPHQIAAEQTIQARNHAFKKYQALQTAKVAGIATGAGIIGSELFATLPNIVNHGFNFDQWQWHGALSGIFLHQPQVPLQEIAAAGTHTVTAEIQGLDNTHTIDVGGGRTLSAPEAVHWMENPDHTRSLVMDRVVEGRSIGGPIHLVDSVAIDPATEAPANPEAIFNTLQSHNRDQLFTFSLDATKPGASAVVETAGSTPPTTDIINVTGKDIQENGSLFGWLNKQTHEAVADATHPNAATGTIDKYWRAFADNNQNLAHAEGVRQVTALDNDGLKIIDYRAIPNNELVTLPVPKVLIENADKIAQLSDEAIYNINHGIANDRVHELALAGYYDTIPSQSEFNEFMNLVANETTTAATTTPPVPGNGVLQFIGATHVTETITDYHTRAAAAYGLETLLASAVAGYPHQPLEAPEKAVTQLTETPEENEDEEQKKKLEEPETDKKKATENEVKRQDPTVPPEVLEAALTIANRRKKKKQPIL